MGCLDNAGGSTLEQIPEGGQPVSDEHLASAEKAHTNGGEKPKKEPLLARLSHGFKRRASGDKAAAAVDASAGMATLAPAVAAH